ncbi:MAG TPA: hypothetical protein VFL13_06895 [Candidatus Baltobacteraceae bacterium]|nr:hypothetical protein [Candidatus Baltobacteraceae bacterium]
MSLFVAAVLSGGALFSQILNVYASHPRAQYVSYTIRRQQQTVDGLPDLEWSYTDRVWYRASDACALERRIFRGRAGALSFAHVSFNGPWDPGPPNADIFGLAGTPETPKAAPGVSLPTIATVVASGGPAYQVTSTQFSGGQWHLRVRPLHVPGTYILREVWADGATLELTKAIVSDKLFIAAGPAYDQLDTMTFALVNGREVITHLHARANFDDQPGGDGADTDYDFSDVAFPATLPDWYFQPASYGAHVSEAPV